MIKLYYRHLNI